MGLFFFTLICLNLVLCTCLNCFGVPFYVAALDFIITRLDEKISDKGVVNLEYNFHDI